MDGGEMVIMIGIDLSLEDQEVGLIQGTVLVAVDEGVGAAEVTLAMTTMAEEVGVVMVVATAGDGLITLAAAAADGAQVAVVAPPGVVVVVPAEDPEAGMLDGVELAVTATAVVVVVVEAGEQLLVVLTVQVVEVEEAREQLPVVMMLLVVEVEAAGEQLLVALTTLVGAAPKRWSEHRMVEAGGGPPVAVVAGDGCNLTCLLRTPDENYPMKPFPSLLTFVLSILSIYANCCRWMSTATFLD
uniref:Uncharacterized protein n=1 Tax=Arundo donax TaxID=35708 RepID=A0A0A9D2F3_ARUDO